VKMIVIALLCCLIFTLMLGLFEVVLEVPYMGSFFWIIMGFIVVIINHYAKDTEIIDRSTTTDESR